MAYESPILIGHHGNLWTGDNAADAAAERPFWAQVTEGPAGVFYGWQEVLPLPPAGFVVREGGRTGTVAVSPAFEPNGGVLTLYSYVLLRRAYYDPSADWVYAAVYAAQVAGGTTTIVSGGGGGSGSTFSGASYSGGVTTSIPSSSYTSLTQTGLTAAYDTDSYGVTLTVPATGYYRGIVDCLIRSPGNHMGLSVSAGAAASGQNDWLLPAGTSWGDSVMQVSWEGHVAAGTGVVIQAYQASGVAKGVSINLQTIQRMG
jgi:hypothetical protein